MGKAMKLASALLICFVSSLFGCSSSEDSLTAQKLEEQYLSALDGWVSSGGNIDDVQNTVVENCGKLVMVTVDGKEKAALSTTDRDEFHFRVDVCTKMTVNRVHPQPEFNKPDTIKVICKESSVVIFQKLCSRSGLI
jgi:hypothetical protein